MERYRLNYVLLIGLVIGGLVSTGTVYALWRFQIDRNAGSLIQRAEEAQADGDVRTAVRYFTQYLTIRPQDDEARVKMALAYADLSELPDARGDELFAVLKVMEDAVRQLPEQDDVRSRLVEVMMAPRVQRTTDALGHVEIMLDRNEDDPKLQVLRSRCLIRAGNYKDAQQYSYEMIGYDPVTGSYDEEKATAPHEAIVYRNLADLLKKHFEMPDHADEVMNQLVKVNPNSYDAYLQRGQYYISKDQRGVAAADIRKAYELRPDDVDVLLSLADVELNAENYDEAMAALEKAKTQDQTNARIYQAMATVEMRRLDYAAALQRVNDGIAEVNQANSLMLLAYKADLQIRSNDIAGTQETINAMEAAGFRSEYRGWVEARVMLLQHKWFEASQELKRVRPQMARLGGVQSQIDVQLGLAYEKLGQLELALDSYNLAIQADPANEPALYGKQRVLARMGRLNLATNEMPWQTILAEELKKPEGEQDWDKIKLMMDEVADQMGLTPAGRMLLDSELLMMRGQYTEARKGLRAAYELEPDDVTIRRAAIRLLAKDPTSGPLDALKLLEKVINKFGDDPSLRLEKADLLIAIGDETRNQEMARLEEGIDDWTREQKVQLYYGLAARYFQMGMRDQARQGWTTVTELSPNDLPTRLMLFTLAHDTNDDAGMLAAQERILEVVDNKRNATWLYTEARRLTSQIRRGQLEASALEQVHTLINQALEQRKDWHELHLLNAELALMEGNSDLALGYYDKAADLGRPYPAATVQHVRLLVERGRFMRAKEIVERLPLSSRQRLLGQLYAEILFNNGLVEKAIQSAQMVIEQEPYDAVKQLWFGQMMARAAQSPNLSEVKKKEADTTAGEAIARAVELDPEIQEGWLALISYHLFHKDRESAEQALREAQLSLSSERLPLVMAKCYEMMGRPFDAENQYKSAHEADPENVGTTRLLANFYLGVANRYTAGEKATLATPYINMILEAGANGQIESNDANLLWARRTAAKLLASTGDYQNLIKAEKLLASNAQDGALPLTDRLQMAQILAPRPEPISRKKALRLLEEVKEERRLNLDAELVMGQLYHALGDWSGCRKQMLEVISRHAESPQVRDSYIRMLLKQGSTTEMRQATIHLRKLMELAPQSPSTLELLARVSAKSGSEEKGRAALLAFLPRDLNKVEDNQLPLVEKIADLLVELNDTETAGKLYQFLVHRLEGDAKAVLKLAVFLGNHRDITEGLSLLDRVYSTRNSPAIVQAAMAIVRERRDEVGDAYDDMIAGWLERGLREDPDSIPLLLQQAELLDLQQRYDDAVVIYEKLLAREDLAGRGRAIVLNNLSFLLALRSDPGALDNALRLVREAVSILGPTADILDTRAVIYIALQKYDLAINDLELSVTDNPTAGKYFHKTIAHLGADENSDALKCWQIAQDMGLSRDSVNPTERESFDDTKAKIEQLRTLNAGYSDGSPLSRVER